MDNEIAAIHETSKMTSQSEKSKLSGLGARLRKARESMHLTQKEAAARLYLNPKIVEVIENEAFFDGPPLTFMRGYLRSYARLLNFPESDIKIAIEELELNTVPVTPTAPALQSNPIYRGDRYIRWITYLIVLTLISLVVLWWSSHSKYVISDVPSTNPIPAAISTTATDVKTTETLPAVPNENTVNTTTITTPTESSNTVATQTTPVAPAPVLKTIPTTTSNNVPPVAVPSAAVPPVAAPSVAQPAVTVTTTPQATALPPAGSTPPQTTALPSVGSTPPQSSPMIAPSSNITPATTAIPGGENPTNVMLNTAAPKEKPATSHKKKHRRHQYRPIENMDIPEPD